MSIRAIVGIAALLGVFVCGILSALVNAEMVEQVNAKLPKADQFFPVGWYAPKTLRLFHEYRRLFPGENLHLKITFLVVAACACLLCVSWAIGFF